MRNQLHNTASLHYPFGMNMERYANIDFAYSYGMNTQEKDDEIYGKGNSYTAEFWQYDARLGRRWNVDPRPNPSVSSYACFGNNPVIFSDMAGDTIKIVGDVDFVANTKSYLNQLYLTERGKKMIDELEKSEKIFTIKEAMNFTSTSYNDEDGTVKYDPTPWIESLDGGCYNGLIGLAHEIRHAYQDLHFQIQKRQNGSYKNRKELEADAVGFANYIRSVYSLGDLRYKYSGLGQLFPKGTTDKQFNPQNEKITITKKYIDIKPVLSSGTVHSDNMRSVIQIHSTILWNYTKTIDEKTEDGGVKRVTNNVKGEPVKSFNSEVTLF